MSKSLNNYIGIDEPPDEMFGKIMSISDETMWLYLELISFKSILEIQGYRKDVEQGMNPRDIKFKLAEEIIERFHSRESALKAKENFIARFQQGMMPSDLPETSVAVGSDGMLISQILKLAGLTSSTSEALRLLDQGGVKLDGERVNSRDLILIGGQTVVLQVGKRRFAKVLLV